MTSRLCEPALHLPRQVFPDRVRPPLRYTWSHTRLIGEPRVNISAAAAASLYYRARQDTRPRGQQAGGEMPGCRGEGVYDIAYRLVSPVLAACLQSWKLEPGTHRWYRQVW